MSVRKTLPLVAGTILIAAATLSAQEPSAPAPLAPKDPLMWKACVGNVRDAI